MGNELMVSICCLSYNHEKYLRQCLEGFVMQQTDFNYEIIIHDDASTDSSQEIIKEYANRYPSLFRPILQKENQYSKGGGILHRFVVPNAKGKYIALCEGDDYWTDPLKLQKQVDFLESHPDYSMCFTNSISKYEDRECISNKMIWDTYDTKQMILHNSLGAENREDCIVPAGHTSTILFRIPQEPLPKWIRECFIGDEPLFIALSTYGKAKFINECTSVYRKNVGVSSKDFSFEKDWNNRIQMYRIINNGLNYQYNYTIKSIIAHYYFKLAKIAKHSKDYSKMFSELIKAAVNNPLILVNRWLY